MKKKPRVCVEVERMKHPFTGLYYYCLHLAENLEKYHGEEFKFTFFKYPGVYFPKHLRSVTRKQWDKIYLYKDFTQDVWHGTWQLTKYIPKGKIKFVYTIHDLNFLYTDKPGYKKKRLLAQIQERIDRADAITVISHYVKKDVEKHLNTKGKPVYVIYNGVELKEFPGFDQPKYRPEKPFLFTVGTVLYKKHFHVLPRLLPGNDYELVIAGIHPDASYIKQIQQEAEKYGVQDRVKLIGPVSDEEKYWYMKHTEAFLFPSISEGFGLPPIEAMKLGKAVFLSTYTSLPEVGGDAAYYFQNFEPEHMQSVLFEGLKDYHEHNRKPEIIRHAAQFSWENAVAGYTQVYRDVLKEKTPSVAPEILNNKKITAIIPTWNEEKNIEAAIDSVSWADEILVIDSYSNDKTVELAQKKGARVIQRKFDNFSAQKNYAIDQASHDWIFVLDADERIDEMLQKEIKETVTNPKGKVAFWIRRKNFFKNIPVRFSGWQNDKCIRLFNKNYARYNGRLVHEEIKAKGPVGMLRNKMLHYTFNSEEQFARKLDLYSKLKAREWFERGKTYNSVKQLFSSVYRFFKHFVLHFGFLDGKAGYAIARHYMKAVWKRYDYLKKLENEKKEHSGNGS